jgi:hypothetical protein
MVASKTTVVSTASGGEQNSVGEYDNMAASKTSVTSTATRRRVRHRW